MLLLDQFKHLSPGTVLGDAERWPQLPKAANLAHVDIYSDIDIGYPFSCHARSRDLQDGCRDHSAPLPPPPRASDAMAQGARGQACVAEIFLIFN